MRRRGSNQYRSKYHGLKREVKRDVLLILLFIAVVAYLLYSATHKPEVISPLAENPWVETVRAAEITPTPIPEPTKANVVAYIMDVFGQDGTHIGVQAIECFYSESGLRADAYNYNTNNTWDYGIPQINQVHGHTQEELSDWRVQIEVAYQIYKRAGDSFRPWYGARCN